MTGQKYSQQMESEKENKCKLIAAQLASQGNVKPVIDNKKITLNLSVINTHQIQLWKIVKRLNNVIEKWNHSLYV